VLLHLWLSACPCLLIFPQPHLVRAVQLSELCQAGQVRHALVLHSSEAEAECLERQVADGIQAFVANALASMQVERRQA